jgi:iron-sulfur cluster insertion protein
MTQTADIADIDLSPAAAARVARIAGRQGKPAVLRLSVDGGGCAGFQYALFFDDRVLLDDQEDEQHGVRVRVDQQSAQHLNGAVIDWKESLEASGFHIDNPNAHASCACGDSFS